MGKDYLIGASWALNESEDLISHALHLGLARSLDVEPEKWLGIRASNVEPPGGTSNGVAVEVINLIIRFKGALYDLEGGCCIDDLGIDLTTCDITVIWR